jgi:hypothetical protein
MEHRAGVPGSTILARFSPPAQIRSDTSDTQPPPPQHTHAQTHSQTDAHTRTHALKLTPSADTHTNPSLFSNPHPSTAPPFPSLLRVGLTVASEAITYMFPVAVRTPSLPVAVPLRDGENRWVDISPLDLTMSPPPLRLYDSYQVWRGVELSARRGC